MIKKGKDLKRGDLIEDRELVLRVKLKSDPKGFWGGNPYYEYLDIYDSYYGEVSRELNLDENFYIITDKKKIVKALKKVDSDLSKYIADMMQLRKDFRELKYSIVKGL